MTDPGHYVLPGDGPLLPPMPLPPELPADDEGCDCDQKASILPHRMSRHVVTSQSGSSEDEVIPQAAIEAAAAATYTFVTGIAWSQIDQACEAAEAARREARAALEAALPHLRPLFTTATRVGYELGRREAAAEFETLAATLKEFADNDRQRMRAPTDALTRAIYKNRADGYGDAAEGIQRVVREVTKGDPNA